MTEDGEFKSEVGSGRARFLTVADQVKNYHNSQEMCLDLSNTCIFVKNHIIIL